jgi:hypothetical protein
VSSIYLVPGNNDVLDEGSADREGYIGFVDALSRQLPGRIRDLTGLAKPLPGSPENKLNGYRLIGLDTAGFKPSSSQMENADGPKSTYGSAPNKNGVQPECEDSDPTSIASKDRLAKIQDLEKTANASNDPFLVFTHIPDVQDSFIDRQHNKKDTCRLSSSWFLNQSARTAWGKVLINKSLVAIFAGHFHSTDPVNYGGPFQNRSIDPRERNASADPLGQVYGAPPISLKNQWGTSQPQRGFLLVDLQNQNVKQAKVFLYKEFDPTHFGVAMSPGTTISPVTTKVLSLLIVFAIVAATWILGVYLGRSMRDSSATAPPKFPFLYPLLDVPTNTYSLSKLQFFAWTALDLFAYTYLIIAHCFLQRQLGMPDLPKQFVDLLGISAGAAVSGSRESSRQTKGRGARRSQIHRSYL